MKPRCPRARTLPHDRPNPIRAWVPSPEGRFARRLRMGASLGHRGWPWAWRWGARRRCSKGPAVRGPAPSRRARRSETIDRRPPWATALSRVMARARCRDEAGAQGFPVANGGRADPASAPDGRRSGPAVAPDPHVLPPQTVEAGAVRPPTGSRFPLSPFFRPSFAQAALLSGRRKLD